MGKGSRSGKTGWKLVMPDSNSRFGVKQMNFPGLISNRQKFPILRPGSASAAIPDFVEFDSARPCPCIA